MNDGQLVARVVEGMRRRGVEATAEQVANALGHHEHTREDTMTVQHAEVVRAAKRSIAAAEDALAGLGTPGAAREAEIEREVVRHGLIAELNTETGAVQAFIPPTMRSRVERAEPPAAAPGRKAKPNSSEGDVPDQASSLEELKALRAKAARLQVVVDDPGASQDAVATAQAALDPILARIHVLEVALRGPTAIGQSRRAIAGAALGHAVFVEPTPYWTRNADPLQDADVVASAKQELEELVEVLNDPKTSVADLAHARARFDELQRQINDHGASVPLDQTGD